MADESDVYEVLVDIRDSLNALRADVNELVVEVYGPASTSPTRKAIRTARA